MQELTFAFAWWQFLLLAIGSYLLGSVNFAVIISKLKHKDIRTAGSGNPGTLNMSRTFGLGIGILTLLLDIVKGAVPALVGWYLYANFNFKGTGLQVSMLTQVMCGFFAVLGHVFPIFMKFKGGKGIATTIGVFAVCNWKVALISGIAAIIFILFTEIGSMGSFIATTPGAIWACFYVYTRYIAVTSLTSAKIAVAGITNLFIVLIIILTWYAHRKNIQRLIAGKEHPTNWLQMIRESIIKKRLKKQQEQENTEKENK